MVPLDEPPGQLPIGVDLDGRLHRLAETPDCKGVGLVFLSTHCPISNGVLPTVGKLSARYQKSGIEFYGVVSAPALKRSVAIRHRDEYRIPFPVLFDASGCLRRQLKPTHTPQALVLSPQGKVLYSGRIDNLYPSVGRKRDAATAHEFEDALAALVAGREIAVPRTEPVGCLLEDAVAADHGTITFNRDVAPILSTRCAECHRPGEAGPFSLLTYDDARAHARQITELTGRGSMPPWHPAEAFGHFRDERRLSPDEIVLIRRWTAEGQPEGDPSDRPQAQHFTEGWRLGKPDLILKMSEAFPLSADGPDVHQHFVLPTGMRRDRLVSAIEFRPGNPRVVHHASFYIDNTGIARKMEQHEPDVGYGSFAGPGFANYGAFRSWLPGMTPQRLPRGMGTYFPADCDLVLEIHYRRSGKPETDQSTVGLYYAESSAKQLVLELQVMNKGLLIPAGADRYEHHASFTLPVAATLLDAAPHMHLLGKEMKATATLPNGEVKPLVWIKDWDFNWQGQYIYADPLWLPQGTRIDVDARFDNSTGNPLNPHSPPQAVAWGEQTQDEMAVCHFRYTCDSIKDLLTTNNAYLHYLADQQERYRQVRKSEDRAAP